MSTSFAPTAGVVPSPADQAPARVAIPQYGIRRILAIWAAAALPMGALAWLVAPALKDSFAGTGNVPMVKALLVCLTGGLIWQFVLVVALLRREQGTLRWSNTRERSGFAHRNRRSHCQPSRALRRNATLTGG